MKWILLLVIVMASVGYGRLYEYREWNAAYANALIAYKRAYDYRDAGTPLYEPRRKDLDGAMEGMARQPTPSFESYHKLGMLRICAGDINLYREIQSANLESVRLGRVPNLDNEANVRHRAGFCIRNETEAGDIP
jgi:hypothetical protein